MFLGGKQLSPQDTDALMAMMDLIGSVVTCTPVAESFLQSDLNPLSSLFGLLACSVSPNLKGAILHTLAAFVYGCPACSADVWAKIEAYRLIPSKVVAASGGMLYIL